ncbi:prenyltransferase/squalene oxidase repeat-containing protein [uncultured Aquimarina sp.]|uniref:prenyltransferase/squalene oxidase repeat-containing protein n=1 Tax=uncultured Aquimarina sp. TaxID=575652 RepID=UPI002615EE6B|nr:prenyltransferase/squalene oxidase repeat-containing protein [uncultured Aquimarina sp.]
MFKIDKEENKVENLIIQQINSSIEQNTWKNMFLNGVNHLIKEHYDGYVNTKHVMPFSPEVFQVTEEFQEGDIFQRALILDTFIDANTILDNLLENIITSEATYLIDSRRKEGVGGWAYFPKLRELPPDADDLAQVMQVLCRSGYKKETVSLFEEPLKVLFRDQANIDNGWESWIIPKENQSLEEQLQTIWVNRAWGKGSDIDVVGNVLYALSIYDKDRFSKEIKKGLFFLYNSHEQYSWKSTWYYGKNYGTYVSIRAICANDGDKQTIRKAVEFLINSRKADGGWALENEISSPLQTALALLGIDIANKYLGISIDPNWLEKSRVFLQEKYNEISGWESSPFIRMPMGRPSGYIHTILTYESATITNNYVTKACQKFI